MYLQSPLYRHSADKYPCTGTKKFITETRFSVSGQWSWLRWTRRFRSMDYCTSITNPIWKRALGLPGRTVYEDVRLNIRSFISLFSLLFSSLSSSPSLTPVVSFLCIFVEFTLLCSNSVLHLNLDLYSTFKYISVFPIYRVYSGIYHTTTQQNNKQNGPHLQVPLPPRHPRRHHPRRAPPDHHQPKARRQLLH